MIWSCLAPKWPICTGAPRNFLQQNKSSWETLLALNWLDKSCLKLLWQVWHWDKSSPETSLALRQVWPWDKSDLEVLWQVRSWDKLGPETFPAPRHISCDFFEVLPCFDKLEPIWIPLQSPFIPLDSLVFPWKLLFSNFKNQTIKTIWKYTRSLHNANSLSAIFN